MSNEIITTYQENGATLYCILIRQNDRLVWSVTEEDFVNWKDENVSNYAISLTNNVDDIYTADMPPVASDRYVWTFYLQSSTEPQITDTVLDAYTGNWTAVTEGIWEYALTDLETVKAELNIPESITTFDNYLIKLINQASRLWETLCDDRHFVARDYTEFTQMRKGRIISYQYPIIDVYSIGWGQVGVAEIMYTDSTAIKATYKIIPAPENSYGLFKISITDENGNETTGTFSLQTYKSLKTLAEAVKLAYPNITFTNITNSATNELLPTKPINILNNKELLYVPSNDVGVQFIRKDSGQIGTGWSVVDEYVMLRYRAGFEQNEIPQDIVNAVTSIVKNMYTLRATNYNMKYVELGNYSYTLGNQDLINPNIREIMDMWTRKSIK